MGRAGEHAQLRQHLGRQTILGQHTLDRVREDELRLVLPNIG